MGRPSGRRPAELPPSRRAVPSRSSSAALSAFKPEDLATISAINTKLSDSIQTLLPKLAATSHDGAYRPSSMTSGSGALATHGAPRGYTVERV